MILRTYLIRPGDKIYLQFRMDEDFGSKLFFGPVRRKFNEKYADTFQHVVQAVQSSVKNLDPTDAKLRFL